MIWLLALAAALTAGPAADASQSAVPDSETLAMLELARLQPGDVVLDMGSGDDRLVTLAAQKYGARGVRVPDAGLLTVDASAATVAILSLPPALMDHVGAKLKRGLRPGSRIVSRQFAIGSWEPEMVTTTAGGTRLLLWTVPRRPAREPDIFFVPTREAVADQMLQLAGITAADLVYDLGAGDGRIVNLAAQKYGASGVGIEIDPPLVAIARQVARDAGVESRATFIEGDLFTADLSRATIVTLYLSPTVNAKLEAKLRRELRPGTRVVSHQFPIGGWEPDKVVPAEDGTDLYVWTVRKQVGGCAEQPAAVEPGFAIPQLEEEPQPSGPGETRVSRAGLIQKGRGCSRSR